MDTLNDKVMGDMDDLLLIGVILYLAARFVILCLGKLKAGK
jgi:hypothetical protein